MCGRSRRRTVPAMRTQTVLVTGASGLLGTWLRRTAPADVTVVALTHRRPVDGGGQVHGDLRDAAAVDRAIGLARPDLVIHAAYTKDEASIVDATRHLVESVAGAGAGIVHISTDAVFAGDGCPRTEEAIPDPVSDYGRWKATAERIVLDADPTAAVVRLPLVVSLEPSDTTVDRIRAGAAERPPTVWFTDEIRQPAPAVDLARALWRIAALPAPERAGPWHLAGAERLSRYEIACRVVDRLGIDHDAITAGTTPGTGDRPRDLHLLDRRARSQIAWAPTPVLTA